MTLSPPALSTVGARVQRLRAGDQARSARVRAGGSRRRSGARPSGARNAGLGADVGQRPDEGLGTFSCRGEVTIGGRGDDRADRGRGARTRPAAGDRRPRGSRRSGRGVVPRCCTQAFRATAEASHSSSHLSAVLSSPVARVITSSGQRALRAGSRDVLPCTSRPTAPYPREPTHEQTDGRTADCELFGRLTVDGVRLDLAESRDAIPRIIDKPHPVTEGRRTSAESVGPESRRPPMRRVWRRARPRAF